MSTARRGSAALRGQRSTAATSSRPRVDTSTLAGIQAASAPALTPTYSRPGFGAMTPQAGSPAAGPPAARPPASSTTRPGTAPPVDMNRPGTITSPIVPPVVPPATTPGEDASRPVTPPDYRDASYNAQIASINRALQDYETGAVRGVQRFGEDFMRGLGSLGFRAGEGFEAAPDITRFRDLAAMQQAMQTPASRMGGARGNWDYEGEINPFSSAARGTRTSRDEFAGRGTLRSSDFAQSYAEFQDRLNEQLAAMQTGRTRTLEDAMSGLVGQRGSAEERRESARLDAVNRAALLAAGGTT
jgi:hypothetical protein